jgi:hypothetical protein
VGPFVHRPKENDEQARVGLGGFIGAFDEISFGRLRDAAA